MRRRRTGRARTPKNTPSWATYERMASDAQRNANATRRTWVVVYRPRLNRYHDYSLDMLQRAPISEPHEIVGTFHPKG